MKLEENIIKMDLAYDSLSAYCGKDTAEYNKIISDMIEYFIVNENQQILFITSPSVKDTLIKSSVNNKDKFFTEAIALADKSTSQSRDKYIILFYRAYKDINPNGKLSDVLSAEYFNGQINKNTTDYDAIQIFNNTIENSNVALTSKLQNKLFEMGLINCEAELKDERQYIYFYIPKVNEYKTREVRALIRRHLFIFEEAYINN